MCRNASATIVCSGPAFRKRPRRFECACLALPPIPTARRTSPTGRLPTLPHRASYRRRIAPGGSLTAVSGAPHTAITGGSAAASRGDSLADAGSTAFVGLTAASAPMIATTAPISAQRVHDTESGSEHRVRAACSLPVACGQHPLPTPRARTAGAPRLRADTPSKRGVRSRPLPAPSPGMPIRCDAIERSRVLGEEVRGEPITRFSNPARAPKGRIAQLHGMGVSGASRFPPNAGADHPPSAHSALGLMRRVRSPRCSAAGGTRDASQLEIEREPCRSPA